jgi:hypothetical protein
VTAKLHAWFSEIITPKSVISALLFLGGLAVTLTTMQSNLGALLVEVRKIELNTAAEAERVKSLDDRVVKVEKQAAMALAVADDSAKELARLQGMMLIQASMSGNARR